MPENQRHVPVNFGRGMATGILPSIAGTLLGFMIVTSLERPALGRYDGLLITMVLPATIVLGILSSPIAAIVVARTEARKGNPNLVDELVGVVTSFVITFAVWMLILIGHGP